MSQFSKAKDLGSSKSELCGLSMPGRPIRIEKGTTEATVFINRAQTFLRDGKRFSLAPLSLKRGGPDERVILRHLRQLEQGLLPSEDLKNAEGILERYEAIVKQQRIHADETRRTLRGLAEFLLALKGEHKDLIPNGEISRSQTAELRSVANHYDKPGYTTPRALRHLVVISEKLSKLLSERFPEVGNRLTEALKFVGPLRDDALGSGAAD